MLIDNWKDGWKFWSVRFQALGAAALIFLEGFPDAFLSIWGVLPPEIQGGIPSEYIRYAGYACICAGVASRFIRQAGLHGADADAASAR